MKKQSNILKHLVMVLLAIVWIITQTPLAMSDCNDFASSMCIIQIELHKTFVKKTEKRITRISIADPGIADVKLITPTQILIISKKEVGSTSLVIWHGDDYAEVYEVKVYVSNKVAQFIHARIRQMIPDSSVKVLSSKDGVILSGEVGSQEMLEHTLNIVKSFVSNFTNLITVKGSQQVQLEVKIAEISRSGIKQMGLGFLNNKDWSIGVFSRGSVTAIANADQRNHLTSTNNLHSQIDIASPFGSAFQIAVHAVQDNTLALLSVLKGQGLARLLASPTLVTMSGQEASFLVGGEFPVPLAGDDGNTTISFKKYGIMLNFTPTVVGKETISLQVEPEISNPDYSLSIFAGGVSVPGLKTRRGSTTLQLKDGQTFIMAGLLKEESSTRTSKIPFLGDIPIIGMLFTNKEVQKNETELVIVVTPRLVKALNKEDVPPLPCEGMQNDLSDIDFFLFNNLESRKHRLKLKSEKRLKKQLTINPDCPLPGFIGETGFTK